jgi:membrane-bound metal-dependent hydrolase YbcI (DUF457 family)
LEAGTLVLEGQSQHNFRVDYLAHGFTGAVVAKAGLSQRMGRGTTTVLVTASLLPDVDTLWLLAGGDGAFLARRMLTHSVFGIPLLCAVAASLFRLRYKNLLWLELFGLCLFGAGLHLFMDLWNTFGVVVFYPVSIARFELAWVFIMDLGIWGLTMTPLLLAVMPSLRPHLKWFCRVALACLACYVGICAWGRWRSEQILRATAVLENLNASFVYVFPEALGPHRFRGVIKTGGEYYHYLVRPWAGSEELKRRVKSEEDSPLVKAARATAEGRRALWFLKAPVWRVVTDENGERFVEVEDLRFQSLVLAPAGAPFTYRFKVRGDRVEPLGWRR